MNKNEEYLVNKYDRRLLTASEVANEIGIHRRTVMQMGKEDMKPDWFKEIKIGGKIMYSVESVARIMSQGD